MLYCPLRQQGLLCGRSPNAAGTPPIKLARVELAAADEAPDSEWALRKPISNLFKAHSDYKKSMLGSNKSSFFV